MSVKKTIISAINAPLGFYALALLIAEASLSVVLVGSDLDRQSKFIGMLIIAGLFLIIVIIVSALVAFRPQNLSFGAKDHLAREQIIYGTKEQPKNKEELGKEELKETGKI